MIKKCLKGLWKIISSILLALYLFVFYELLIIPAVLDWSTFGVGLTLLLTGLLIWCIPAEKRLSTAVMALTFLLSMKAMDNIRDFPLLNKVIGTVFIFFVLLLVGWLLGRFSISRYLVIFLVALILNATIEMSQVRFWTEFGVKWVSPVLYKKLGSVDYFPITLADVDGDGTKEIITQQNLELAAREQRDIAENGITASVLEPESNRFAVYKWDGETFRETPSGRYNLDRLVASLPVDYLGYPLYETALKKNNRLEQQLTPLLDRAQLVEKTVRFGSLPFELLKLNQKSLAGRIKTQPAPARPAQSTAEAMGDLIPGPPAELVTIDNSLKVWDSAAKKQVLGTLSRENIPDIGTAEVLTGDVDYDQTDELLLTAETSRILKLSKEGKWETLWASPEVLGEKARFQKFRFEDFAALGSDPTPHIIALSKSNVRENPTRYMTGYIYNNGTLHQKWRVFSGLINLRAGDVDGDGQNELAGYMYRRQQIFVLEKHNLPVVQGLYVITGALIIAGFWVQWKQKRKGLNGGGHMVKFIGRFLFPLTLTVLIGIAVLLSGCAIKSGPGEFAKPEPSKAKPAANAPEKLARAFENTVRNGKKFRFSGWGVTKIQKRKTDFYTTGTYDKDKGYLLDVQVFGHRYRYYRWGNDVYVSEQDKWRRIAPTENPLEPFADFSKLLLLAGKAVQLPDGEVLGKKCNVYQITLDSSDALRVAESMGIDILGENTGPGKQYFNRLQMKFTIWVGLDEKNKENFIYQYKTEATMPVPNAGSLYQEVFYKFYDYNSNTVNIPTPREKIEPYLIKD